MGLSNKMPRLSDCRLGGSAPILALSAEVSERRGHERERRAHVFHHPIAKLFYCRAVPATLFF